jgi:hypothetical protein
MFADPQCVGPGEFSRITNPAALAQATAWRLLPTSPCLKGGLNLEKQFRVNPGRTDFYGNPIGRDGVATIGAAGPLSVAR